MATRVTEGARRERLPPPFFAFFDARTGALPSLLKSEEK